jgi:hypothetical protein
VLSYLKLKGEILFLFDNLDRMRAPSGFDAEDGLLLLGLIESMQDIAKQFRRAKFSFRWKLSAATYTSSSCAAWPTTASTHR